MTDKVVLITGGAKRVGAQLVRFFHNAGYHVILHYHRSVSEAENLYRELLSARQNSVSLFQCDLVNIQDWNSIAEHCLSFQGRLDVLVNNASAFYPTPTGEAVDQDWQNIVGSNLKAPFFLSQSFAAALTGTSGCIINIADIHGIKPLKNYTIYSIAKAGLIMLTRCLALELAPGVRVNGIAPGAVLWPADLSEEVKTKILKKVPLKRVGNPEDVARTALFLAEDAPYINGQIITVDGGRSLT